MTDPIVVDVLRSLHLIGLALGLGLAIFADLRATSGLLRPLTSEDLRLLHRTHRTVVAALALLWATGLGLLFMRTGFDPALIADKVWAKLGVVVVLTLNACVMGGIALPVLRDNRGWAIAELPAHLRVRLLMAGGVSAASWMCALLLGAISALRPLPLDVLLPMIAAVYLAALCGAALVTAVLPLAERLHRQLDAGPDHDFGRDRDIAYATVRT